MDLAHLLQQPEGKTLEFKRDLSSADRVLHTLVAFANTADDGERLHSASPVIPSDSLGPVRQSRKER